MNVDKIRDRVNALKAKYDHARQTVKKERQSLNEARNNLEATEQARDIIQVVSANLQETAHKQIAYIVTRCLQATFGYGEFKINFDKKRGKTESRLVFTEDGNETDPLKERGGGIVDVAAFALRLACLILSKPKKRRLLVLDEPFRFVSKHYRPKVRELLETLSTEMSCQFILVTHDEELMIGKTVQLTK